MYLRAQCGDGTGSTVSSNAKLGLGINNPTHLIHLAGGAYSDGAVWQDASSCEYKEAIFELSAAEALSALSEFSPVHFRALNSDVPTAEQAFRLEARWQKERTTAGWVR